MSAWLYCSVLLLINEQALTNSTPKTTKFILGLWVLLLVLLLLLLLLSSFWLHLKIRDIWNAGQHGTNLGYPGKSRTGGNPTLGLDDFLPKTKKTEHHNARTRKCDMMHRSFTDWWATFLCNTRCLGCKLLRVTNKIKIADLQANMVLKILYNV